MTELEVKQLIEAALPGARVEVHDTTGTGDHFAARIAAPQFAGKTMLQQHQMVYQALQKYIHGSQAPIHALSLHTSVLET